VGRCEIARATATRSEPRGEDLVDFVVVGSGAGGGPVAANLARAGMRVVLLEAGTDAENHHYQVPCFHALATEDPEYRWDYFVRHYDDDAQQEKDPKYVAERDGVLYPRAGTLGGCTAHNAMITVYPHNHDWDEIARLTGDRTWRSGRMRRYFERLERCRYARRPWSYPRSHLIAGILRSIPILSWLFGNRSRHGFDGWLTTSFADPTLAISDGQLLAVILAAAKRALVEDLGRPLTLIEDLVTWDPKASLDPNHWRVQTGNAVGLWLTPLATRKGVRNGTRELLKDTQQRFPQNLDVRTGCLATRVLFDDGRRAMGVEYLQGEHAYRADPRASARKGRPALRQVFVRREVILAAGAFNTPQLLELSGIGPSAELARLGIPTVVDLPGVGQNLQDRYEVGVVTEMTRDFSILRDCTFDSPAPGQKPDPCFEAWRRGEGLYCTNGAVLGVIKRSTPERALPDLFIFGTPASFHGYFPGYSAELEHRRNFFTWVILKAHTRNTAGRVSLRSADPRDPPNVTFRYFDEGSDHGEEDLDGVVEGVRFARGLLSAASEYVKQEVVPGDDCRTKAEIREFVRNEAWGHHACGTCKIGRASDPLAVVDSRFRVRGTKGLRVVDASVFPRIPGFFIVTSIYMAAEKASDAILSDVPVTTRAVQLAAAWAPEPVKRKLARTTIGARALASTLLSVRNGGG
jgi:choline dehydrogenase